MNSIALLSRQQVYRRRANQSNHPADYLVFVITWKRTRTLAVSTLVHIFTHITLGIIDL